MDVSTRDCKKDLWTQIVQFERIEKKIYIYKILCFSLKCICQWLFRITERTWEKLKYHLFSSWGRYSFQIWPETYWTSGRQRPDIHKSIHHSCSKGVIKINNIHHFSTATVQNKKQNKNKERYSDQILVTDHNETAFVTLILSLYP